MSGRGVRAPAWLVWAAAAALAGSVSQLAYAVHPRKGPFIGYLEVACVPLLIAWGLWRLRAGLQGLRWPPWPVWAFLAVAVLSLAKATSLKAGAIEIAQYVLYFVLLYMLFCDAFAGRAQVAWGALAAGLGVAAAVALVQLLSGAEAMEVRGLAGNRNVYSALGAVLLPLVWAGVNRPTGELGRWSRMGAVAGATVALCTMLGPPHVWIAVVAVAAVGYTVGPGEFWRLTVPVLGVAVAVNLLSPAHRACNLDECLNPWETGNVYKLLRESGADEHLRLVKKRWLEWYPALAMMADNPLLGVGAGNYQLNIGRPEYWAYIPNAKKTEPDTNNLYLVVGASMGFGGLAALVGMLAVFGRRASEARPRWLAAGLVGAIAALAAANLFTALLVRGAAVAWAGLFSLATAAGASSAHCRAASAEQGGNE